MLISTAITLIGIRSGIAHTGNSNVLPVDVSRMRQLCLRTLLALSVSPAFTPMTESRQLGEWFTDRLLDSPNHLANLDQPDDPLQDPTG